MEDKAQEYIDLLEAIYYQSSIVINPTSGKIKGSIQKTISDNIDILQSQLKQSSKEFVKTINAKLKTRMAIEKKKMLVVHHRNKLLEYIEAIKELETTISKTIPKVRFDTVSFHGMPKNQNPRMESISKILVVSRISVGTLIQYLNQEESVLILKSMQKEETDDELTYTTMKWLGTNKSIDLIELYNLLVEAKLVKKRQQAKFIKAFSGTEERIGEEYKIIWLKSHNLLAYFLMELEVNLLVDLKNYDDLIENKKLFIKEGKNEVIKALAQKRNNIEEYNKKPPKGYEKIDSIIKAMKK